MRKRILWTILALLLVFLALFPLEGSAAQDTLFPSDNERFGFGVTTDITQFDVSQLHAGWYVNWGAAPSSPHPDGLIYVQILRLCDPDYHSCPPPYYTPNGESLARIVHANPGVLWLVGNEPDCPYQDSVGPERYARIYHDVYNTLKSLDPSAQVGIGGMVQASPLRMKWLNRVWSAYQQTYGSIMPVDVWNVHAFVLREVRPGHLCDGRGAWGAGIPPGLDDNCGMLVGVDDLDRMDIFDQQIRRFRQWMKNHGQQDKPLIVSEYGILFNQELGYGYERVRDYMLGTFDYFLNTKDQSIGYPEDDFRLVQRWAWYSLDDDNFGWGTTWSALFDPHTHQINQLGLDFGKYTAPLVRSYVDLTPDSINLVSAPVYGEKTAVDVRTSVFNWGNSQSPASAVRVSTGGVQEKDSYLPPVPRRYAGEATSSTKFSLLVSGPTTLTVKVDPNNIVPESREGNNTATMSLTVNLSAGNLISNPRVPFVGSHAAFSRHSQDRESLGNNIFFPTVSITRRTSVTLSLSVRNRGDVIIPQPEVQFGLGKPGMDVLGTVSLPALAPGEEKSASLVWPDAPAGTHRVWAWVDPQNEVREGNETDNISTLDLLISTRQVYLPLGMKH